MLTADLSTLVWRKSSYSGLTKEGNCVEVARALDAVAVRDSKVPCGPALMLTPAAFARFVRSIR